MEKVDKIIKGEYVKVYLGDKANRGTLPETLIGKVICFSQFIDGKQSIGIDFGIGGPMFHDLDGELHGNTGLYVGPQRIDWSKDNDDTRTY